MKTAIAADEPDPRPVTVHYGPATTTFAGTAAPVGTTSSGGFVLWMSPPTTDPVGSTAPRDPYRTTAWVGTPVPEIEESAD